MNCNPEGLDPPTSLKGLPVGWFKCVDLPGLYGSFIGYYLVSVCSASWLSSGVRDLCEMSTNRSDIIGSLPVYNNETLVNYKNIYCAICHGEPYERMIPWTVRAAYYYQFGGPSTIPNFDVVIPGAFAGSFAIEAPDNGLGDIRGCTAPTLDTCLDEFSGSETEQGCNSFAGAIAYRPVIGGPVTNFRNAYCAKCNNFTLTLRDSCGYDLCTEICDITYPWALCSKICEGATDLLTLDVLFSFKSESTSPENVISCMTGQIYDPFIGICRVLSCAPGFEIQGNECAKTVSPPSLQPNVTGSTGGSLFAYNVNNTVNVGLVDCLRFFLGGNTQGIVYWDATMNSSENVALLTVNLLAKNETVVDDIQTSLNCLTDNCGVCNISQMALFLEVENVLPADVCKKYNVSGLSLFTEYLMSKDVFLISQFDFSMNLYISEIDHTCLKNNLTCVSFVTLNSTEFVQSGVGNETVLELVASGRIVRKHAYVVLRDKTAVVCADFLTAPQSPTATELVLSYLSIILNTLSVISLALTFIVYCLLPPLRNLAGQSIMNLAVALFTANILLLLSGYFIEVPTLCLIVAPVIHFTWLAAFMWMAVLSFNVARTLSSTVVNQTHISTTKPLLRYMLFAWGIPLVIVSICIALHFCQCTSTAQIYADEKRCYIVSTNVNLYAFGVPVALTLTVSICLFVYTVVFLRTSRSSTRIARNETRLQEAKVEFVIYVRVR